MRNPTRALFPGGGPSATSASRALSHLLALTFLSATWCAAATEPRESVVKVYVQSLETRYSSPWDGGRVEAFSGSGFVIAGQRILTNAHVIAGATLPTPSGSPTAPIWRSSPWTLQASSKG